MAWWSYYCYLLDIYPILFTNYSCCLVSVSSLSSSSLSIIIKYFLSGQARPGHLLLCQTGIAVSYSLQFPFLPSETSISVSQFPTKWNFDTLWHIPLFSFCNLKLQYHHYKNKIKNIHHHHHLQRYHHHQHHCFGIRSKKICQKHQIGTIYFVLRHKCTCPDT